MKLSLFSTLWGYRKEYLPKDIFSGIIIAAVSIPISMGYAQIDVYKRQTFPLIFNRDFSP